MTIPKPKKDYKVKSITEKANTSKNIESEFMTTSIAGLDKAEVLLNLWNASKGQGLSSLGRHDVTLSTCQEALSRDSYVDYLGGRVIKCDFSKDSLDPWGFDRDNGEGRALRVIEKMRSGIAP